MHAIAAGLITCAAKGCHQPGTVTVVAQLPPDPAGVRPDGSEKWAEHGAALIDYCERHAPACTV